MTNPILEFRDSLGPALGEAFDLMVNDMIHEGAQRPVEDIENKINEVKKNINKINTERSYLSEAKHQFEEVYDKLLKFCVDQQDVPTELVMFRLVLKSRIDILDNEIKETKPKQLLKLKARLKARKDFLQDNRELGFHLLDSLYMDDNGRSNTEN